MWWYWAILNILLVVAWEGGISPVPLPLCSLTFPHLSEEKQKQKQKKKRKRRKRKKNQDFIFSIFWILIPSPHNALVLLIKCLGVHHWPSIDPFRIRRATSVPLGKGTKFALHHGKMSTTKRRAIQILHISTIQFTFKRGYNYFISKYTDINSLHATQIDLLHNDTSCST